jgi:hypothetical protein
MGFAAAKVNFAHATLSAIRPREDPGCELVKMRLARYSSDGPRRAAPF